MVNILFRITRLYIMNIKKEICDFEIMILMNRTIYENHLITKDKFGKINNILIKKIFELRDKLDAPYELSEDYE